MSVCNLVPIGDETRLTFYCPGCKCSHGVPIDGPKAWQWNNDLEKPTISPSILVRWHCNAERADKVCHSFVRNGCIEFLNDCSHSLAGQTVVLQEE